MENRLLLLFSDVSESADRCYESKFDDNNIIIGCIENCNIPFNYLHQSVGLVSFNSYYYRGQHTLYNTSGQ